MRTSRWLPAGLALLVAVCAVGFTLFNNARSKQPTLVVRDAYLLVSVEATPAWIEQHRPTINWEGRGVRLPVVFRYRAVGPNGPNWGAVTDESQQALIIQGVQVPVRVTPMTVCRVSNEPAVGLIPEQGDQRMFSIATWVSVGPQDRASVSPTHLADRMLSMSADVASKVKDLIALGQVIDVALTP